MPVFNYSGKRCVYRAIYISGKCSENTVCRSGCFVSAAGYLVRSARVRHDQCRYLRMCCCGRFWVREGYFFLLFAPGGAGTRKRFPQSDSYCCRRPRGAVFTPERHIAPQGVYSRNITICHTLAAVSKVFKTVAICIFFVRICWEMPMPPVSTSCPSLL